jgi:DNA-binding NtrC family response regulator
MNSTLPDKPNPELPILLVDDEEQALMLMSMTLKVAGYENVKTTTNGNGTLDIIKCGGSDCVVLDMVMPPVSGLDILRQIKEYDPEIPVIMATGINELETAVSCMKHGAQDYIVKPIDSDRFLASVKQAIAIREMKRDYENVVDHLLSSKIKNPDLFSSIITRNAQMLTIFRYIEAIAPAMHPVLITGETGTGKELIARAIHDASALSGKFVAVNVAGLDDTVFSDTLFGHVKGAFTGADSVRPGMIETAAGGTLFLDEIGDLSVQSQVKLLRLLQEKEYHPLGCDKTKNCSARIVTATCKELSSLENDAGFRRDLFFRLRTHHIHVPPLRDRKDDLEVLTETFLKTIAAEQKKPKPTVPAELYTLLRTYHFPGNIRELQGMVTDAVSQHESRILSLQVFRERIGKTSNSKQSDFDSSAPSSKVNFGSELPTLEEIEAILVNEALARAQGNQSIAADLLGITRQALAYRLKKKV